MKLPILLIASLAAALTLQAAATYKKSDRLRPRPTVVTPATADKPPSDAIILFDGTNLDHWINFNPKNPDEELPARWIITGNYAEANRGQLQTREKFADVHLHLEYRCSPEELTMPVPAGQKPRIDQKRGNSGIEFGDHPEIQLLDSYENDTYPDGQAAAIYGYFPPLVNACLPPGEWQTLDIYYTAPRQGAAATYTIIHNNIPVHIAAPVPGDETSCRIRIRPHGGHLRYRNIWIRPLHAYDENANKPLPENARTTDPFKK